ncbi:MAG TPA: branched-chain amino acid ABC transporter permease [Thermoanaerobaculia bacterium]|nr:branched-chain amino acid ABC transporter permease [Thermoanaerobaculia bacterium]
MKGVLAAVGLLVGLLVVNGLLTGTLVPGVSISPYFLQVLCLAGINITLAVSLNLINGFTGQFSIGHAGFMAIGAYASAFFTVTFGDSVRKAFGLLPGFAGDSIVLLIGLAIGALLASVAGFIVGVPSLRLRGDYLAIVTLGFGEMIRVFILNIDAVGGARGFAGIPKLANFFWIYGFAALAILIVYRIVHSSFGRTLIAIREDEIAAEAMGVHTTRAKVIAFVVSAAMAGVAGGLFAHYLMYVNTNSFTFLKSFEIIIMIVIGGLGSISGSVLGAVLYITLTEGLREFAQYRMLMFSLLLVVLMIVRPQGILGHKEFVTFLTRRRRSIGEAPGTAGNA